MSWAAPEFRTHKNVAEIYYYFYEDAITDVFEQLDDSYQCNFLTDGEGAVFYASDASLHAGFHQCRPVISGGKHCAWIADGPFGRRRYLYVTQKLSSYDWYCVSLIALDDLIRVLIRCCCRFY